MLVGPALPGKTTASTRDFCGELKVQSKKCRSG